MSATNTRFAAIAAVGLAIAGGLFSTPAAGQPDPAPAQPPPVEQPAAEPAEPPPGEQPASAPAEPPLVEPLVPAPADSPPVTRPPPETDEPAGDEEDGPTSHMYTIAWVGFGVATVGIVTWAITGGIALGKTQSLKDDCPEDVCPADLESDLDDARTLGNIATAGLVIGILGGAWGITALLAAGEFEDAEAAQEGEASATVRPLIGPGYLGLSGRF